MRQNNAFAPQALPPRSSAAMLLSKGVTRLEGTLKLTTAILALAAGVYTFLGVRELLNGRPGMVLFAAVIYSVAVSVGIYAFWVFLINFMPLSQRPRPDVRLLATGLSDDRGNVVVAQRLGASRCGCDPAASCDHRTRLYPRSRYRQTNAIAAQGLLPDIQLASSRFAKLADAERAGSLTGTAGSGTVVQLLTQMSGQLDSLDQQAQASDKRVPALYERGSKSLAKMREFDFRPRVDFGAQRCIGNRVADADGRDRQSTANFRGTRGQARGGVTVL